MFEWIASPEAWVALLALTTMEIVLGIDNIVFITILCGRLPQEKQLKARRLGLAVALISRLVLLGGISWIMKLKEPLFELMSHAWSGKDLILLFGGLFLIYKATHEIYENVEHPGGDAAELADSSGDQAAKESQKLFTRIILQIMLIDIVFSLDSVITAVGMAEHLSVMMIAVMLAVGVMMVFAGAIGDFIQTNPSVRILALAFLLLIGVMLVAEGSGQHVSKGYIYSAMAFSLLVEMFNLRMRKKEAVAAAPAAESS